MNDNKEKTIGYLILVMIISVLMTIISVFAGVIISGNAGRIRNRQEPKNEIKREKELERGNGHYNFSEDSGQSDDDVSDGYAVTV